ncbi:MAG: hypothetical protein MUO67_09575 [Anaerolineales bacterium]|nr:hypothetical protein [Anaerolineales bacterium]
MNLKFKYKPHVAVLLLSWFMLVCGYSQVANAQDATPTPIPPRQSTPGLTSEPIETSRSTDEQNNSIGNATIPTASVTPTPTSDPGTNGSINLTPEGVLAVVIITPAPEATASSGGGISVDLSDLTLQTLVQSLISIAVIIIAAILGSRLIYLVLRRLVRRTETEFDDQLLETIRPQIIWLLAAMGFQFITFQAAFLNGDVFETIYVLLYWFVAVAIAWRSIDFASA